MSETLSATEMQHYEQALHDYAPAQAAMASLNQHQGNLDAALEEMLIEEYGPPQVMEGTRPSLWEVTKTTLRAELCSDEGFIGKIKGYLDKPQEAASITAIVTLILEQVALSISPAIATLVALYLVKVGLTIFCNYTAPDVEG